MTHHHRPHSLQTVHWGLQPLFMAMLVVCGNLVTPLHAQQVQMNLVQSPGCTFSNQQRGTLGLSQDWRTLGTDLPEGRRPSVRVLNTGQVVLTTTQSFGLWTRDNAPFSMSNSIVFLRDQSSLGNAINLPLLLTTPGYRDLYLEATGTSSSGNFPGGLYRIAITLSCM